MSWLLPVRNRHVCCASGPRLRSGLEVWRGAAARGEGPAGYKDEGRAGEAAPRDPTAAGDPEPQPRDDCEFKAATSVNTQPKRHLQLYTSSYIHTLPVPCMMTLLSALINRYVYDKFLQGPCFFFIFGFSLFESSLHTKKGLRHFYFYVLWIQHECCGRTSGEVFAAVIFTSLF